MLMHFFRQETEFLPNGHHGLHAVNHVARSGVRNAAEHALNTTEKERPAVGIRGKNNFVPGETVLQVSHEFSNCVFNAN